MSASSVQRRCSFCGVFEHEASRLLPGTDGAAICGDCVVRLFAQLDREAFDEDWSTEPLADDPLHGRSDA
ncbi:ClpX C4-type zinc finger protein [Myxococcus sp. K15C18031901]|uniref:ClpX C4-type zinc finger protein n=1 Tax=Myxococcus dinghuensis TaxID=2906761 RepID=UPI0020A789EB|nr:ClpX C4-type zinc finger protein [Myxococcus dinghuensis]MCP3100599.1 ClpX C4-type zinc finger protein [Myxococcus dinghuensis]